MQKGQSICQVLQKFINFYIKFTHIRNVNFMENGNISYPRIEISLDRISRNLEKMIALCHAKGIQLTPVTKGVCGSVEIARMLSKHDIHSIADSHIQNIIGMKDAGVPADFMLLRAPMREEVEAVVAYCAYCLVSELSTIIELDREASRYDRQFRIILMIELGARREGILAEDLDAVVERILPLKNIRLSGIGANLACLNGIKPTAEKMEFLSQLVSHIRSKYGCELEIVSGGNSANNQWLRQTGDPGMINHLRMGEAILLGTDPITQQPIDGLETGAFVLSAEVIESMRKPSLPEGIPTFTAFGEVPVFVDEGDMNRALLAVGLQDLDPLGCAPRDPSIRIVGTTSDHMVLNSTDKLLKVGEVVKFDLTYRALLRLMISPYVGKVYVK